MTAPTPNAAESTKRPGFVYEGDLDTFTFYDDHRAGILIYEVVRSGQLAPVQWSRTWTEIVGDGLAEREVHRAVAFEFFASDDFAACASYGPFTYQTTSHPDPKRILVLEQERFDHELIRGHCVAMRPIAKPTAKSVLRQSNGGLYDLTFIGADGETFTGKNQYQLLAHLGIDVGPTGHDLWSRDDNSRAVDPVTDAELVRAVKASVPMRNAVLRLINSRATTRYNVHGCRWTNRPLVKTTGPAVASAILDTGILAHSPDRVRRQAMFALSAIQLTTDHDRLAKQLIAGLEQPMDDNRTPAEIARQGRVAALGGDDFAAVPDGRPMYLTIYEFEHGAAVALMAGDDVVATVAKHFESELRRRNLRGSDSPCTDQLVARAPYGESAILELMNRFDQGLIGGMAQRRIQAMAATAAKKSSRFKDAMLARCARPEGFLPRGNRAQADSFCKALKA